MDEQRLAEIDYWSEKMVIGPPDDPILVGDLIAEIRRLRNELSYLMACQL